MPCVDMVATGKRIKAMRVAKGMTALVAGSIGWYSVHGQ